MADDLVPDEFIQHYGYRPLSGRAQKTWDSRYAAYKKEQASRAEPETTLLTPEEDAVLMLSVALWNGFIALPTLHPDDQTEVRHMIHAIQDKIMSRPVRRQFPKKQD